MGFSVGMACLFEREHYTFIEIVDEVSECVLLRVREEIVYLHTYSSLWSLLRRWTLWKPFELRSMVQVGSRDYWRERLVES